MRGVKTLKRLIGSVLRFIVFDTNAPEHRPEFARSQHGPLR